MVLLKITKKMRPKYHIKSQLETSLDYVGEEEEAEEGEEPEDGRTGSS